MILCRCSVTELSRWVLRVLKIFFMQELCSEEQDRQRGTGSNDLGSQGLDSSRFHNMVDLGELDKWFQIKPAFGLQNLEVCSEYRQ